MKDFGRCSSMARNMQTPSLAEIGPDPSTLCLV